MGAWRSAACDTAGMPISHGSIAVLKSYFLILLLNLKAFIPLNPEYYIRMSIPAVHLVCKQFENS